MSDKSEKSEQWNLDGDCSLCRRKNYCSKRCTLNKRKSEILMRSLVASKLNEITGGAYSEINMFGGSTRAIGLRTAIDIVKAGGVE